MKGFSFPVAIKQPSVIPYLLNGDNAEAFLKEFSKLVKTDYADNPNLKVLNLRDVNGVPTVVGSNPLVLPLVQRIVGSSYRVARPEDIQATLNDGDTLSIEGNHYVDMGVVLDLSGRNNLLARDFYEQLPKELRRLEVLPAVVVGYGLRRAKEQEYGIRLMHQKGTALRVSPILAKETGAFNNAEVNVETGLPTRLGNGSRTLHTATQKAPSLDNLGLSGLCLYRSLVVDSNDGDNLANSNDNGLMPLPGFAPGSSPFSIASS